MRIPVALIAAGVIAGTQACSAAPPAQAVVKPSCRFVFLSPHQDDETLSMGAAIRQHVEQYGGPAVCVALFTTGEHSGARRLVPDPAMREDVKAFGAARDAEFRRANAALGVPAGNVYVDDLPGWSRVFDDNRDESLQKPLAREFVAAAVAHFGAKGVHYKTLSTADPSVDHRVLGEALRERANEVGSVRLYYPQYRIAEKPKSLAVYPQRAKSIEAQRRAAAAYGPGEGPGIGWLSVAAAFGSQALKVRPVPPVKRPNTAYTDTWTSLVHF